MALNDKQRAANWQEPATPPVPVKHVTPVKIDLKDSGVAYEDGKIVAITGTLCVVPHTSSQFAPLAAFFKTGPVECQLEDNHTGNTLSVKFTLQRVVGQTVIPPTVQAPTPLPTASDLDTVAAEKLTKAKTDPNFEEAVQFVMSKHGYPQGAAEAVVAEFGVADIMNDKSLEAIEDKFKEQQPPSAA